MSGTCVIFLRIHKIYFFWATNTEVNYELGKLLNIGTIAPRKK